MKRALCIVLLTTVMTGCAGNMFNRPTGPDALFKIKGGRALESFVSIEGEPTGQCSDIYTHTEPVPASVSMAIDRALAEIDQLTAGNTLGELRTRMQALYMARTLDKATVQAAAIERRLIDLENRIRSSGIDELRDNWTASKEGEEVAGCSLPVERYDGTAFDFVCMGMVAKKCRECGEDPRRCTFLFAGPFSGTGDTTIIARDPETVSVRIR